VDRIEPIAPDRSVQRVDLTYLTPIEREREKERRERERERRRRAPQAPSPAAQDRPAAPPEGMSGGIDVRA
jgi:hypothetical protein